MLQDGGSGDHDTAPAILTGPSLQDPTAGGRLPNQPVPIPASALFQSSSGNVLHNSPANAANRDIWNIGNLHVHPQQPVSTFRYIFSTFTDLLMRRAVTLGSPRGATSTTAAPNPHAATPNLSVADPAVIAPVTGGSQPALAESPRTGTVEVTLLDDLDIDTTHLPGSWYRSPDLPGGLSLDGIYIKKLYPRGYGYPCPYPCPQGRPVRIGDIGELTSAGFTALANLADCQLPSLQPELMALVLSDPWREGDYLPEGQSITGGAYPLKINRLPGSKVIQDIKYRCHDPQGAILAVASKAQLETLLPDTNRRLRAWLCRHGVDLLQFLDPHRTESLYIVTGVVTSSSWANATYAEPLPEPDNSLLLTNFPHDVPPYHWTEPGNSRNWSKSSSVINPEGDRKNDQCLFLRGFLLTPSAKYKSHRASHALKASNPNHGESTGESNSNMDASGGALGGGSSLFTQSSQPSSGAGASHEATMSAVGAWNSERDAPLVEEVPSEGAPDFYPSHRINKHLLELSNADLAITHDDDWRFKVEALQYPSIPGFQKDVGSIISGGGTTSQDENPLHHFPEHHQDVPIGEQEKNRADSTQSLHEFERTRGSSSLSEVSAHREEAEAQEEAEGGNDRQSPPLTLTLMEAAKETGTSEATTLPRRLSHISSVGRRFPRPLLGTFARSKQHPAPYGKDTVPRTLTVASSQIQATPLDQSVHHFTDTSSNLVVNDIIHNSTFTTGLDVDIHPTTARFRSAVSFALDSVPNLRRIHNDVLGMATPGTGAWFFSWETFLMWLDGLLKIIWGFGLLGAGKTVFTSIVIDYLETRASRDLDSQTCVCYVYFRHNDCSLFTFRTVLEILVKQTLERHASCQVLAEEVYKRHIREKTQPGEPELLQLLREFTSRMSATFYVLEALDEAPVEVRFRLVQALASLNVKLFITSRPLHTLSACFPDAHCFAITAQDTDLDIYIAAELANNLELPDLWHEEIASLIKQNCYGMFLYASLQMEALMGCPTFSEMKQTLRRHPPRLDDVYSHIWGSILAQRLGKARLIKSILLWVLTASRPMRIEELRCAVATSPDTHDFDPNRLVQSTQLIDICSGLIYIEAESRIVRVSHPTVRTRFGRAILEAFPHPHHRLAEVCITHLAVSGFQHAEVRSTADLVSALQNDPLLAYAHYAWASHGRESMEVRPFRDRLAKFVEGCDAYPVALGDAQQLEFLGPLHVAAFFDLPLSLAGMKALTDPNNPTREKGLTPLILACQEGSTGAVEELLGLPGTLANGTDNNGWTPLHWASCKGCEGVIERLLVHPEIQPNAANQDGQTPLTLASRNGHAGATRLLLTHSQTAINLPDRSGHTALTLASLYGHEEVVRLLLAHAGVEVNLKAVNGRSALFFASLHGHGEIVKLFLASPGVEVGSDMFLAASSEGHFDTAQLLETALFSASSL